MQDEETTYTTEQEGQGNSSNGSGDVDPGANNAELDGRGSATTGDAQTGDGDGGSGQAGYSEGIEVANGNSESTSPSGDTGNGDTQQLQAEGMGNSQTQVSDSQTVQYEGVTASQFDDAMQQIQSELSALNASCLLLVAAIFACFGSICVQTLLRSLTWDK